MRLFFKFSILLLSFGFVSNQLVAQQRSIFNTPDLSNIKVDLLTDDEIQRYREQVKEAGMTEVQAEQLIIQRGIPRVELIKLKARIDKLENQEKRKSATENSDNKRATADTTGASRPAAVPRDPMETYVFGSEIFLNNTIASFEPNLRIATPQNYTLGPDDELLIDLYGYQEVNYKITISPEGTITMPYVGVISLVGLTVEQATKKIRDRMIRNGYASLGSGQSKLEVNVGRIKSIKVTIVGEAKTPGTYTVSGLANMFNALYQAGGVTNKGSFRKIELIRNNRVIDVLDVYDFLLKADLSNNRGLMDQDVIRIPVADVQVEIRGEVKREGIFEMLPGETVNDLIRFTGGFTSEAYTAAIHIQQLTETQRQLKDVFKNEFSSYTFRKGDVAFVDKILESYANRVIINGAVSRPGQFELTPGLTLSQLIRKADGLKEDAFRERALLTRRNENGSTEYLPVQLDEVMRGGANDIVLRKEDNITITSIFEYISEYKVTIQGEVRKPGDYRYVNNISLKDLLFQAGGLTDAAAPQQIEIARRLSSDSVSITNPRIAQVINVASEKDLMWRGNDIKLSPWDIVIIRTLPGYKPQVSVRIEGEVLYPGTYVLATKEERISDLINRSGGLTPQAYLGGAFLTRINNSNTVIKQSNIEKVQKIQEGIDDTTNTVLEDVTKSTVKVGLSLGKILDNPKTIDDILLQEGDVLTVGKAIFEIKINGEVLSPTQVVYRKGENLKYYIDKSGGFTDDARKRRTYVLYANGSAGKTKNYVFFRNYPKIEPGSEILVPKIPAKINRRLSTPEVIGITTGIASLVGVLVALISTLK
ncbi:MAG TPA: SLBB domain-containing protein [Segetibacter sp.]|jgi:protein involved in polysaccharide export with SLBB domain